MSPARKVLALALIALVVLYAAWFGARTPPSWGALAVFALPPAWLALGVLRGSARAGFWSAVLALAWFSHGVMVAYSRPPERLPAWAELVLAVIVVFAASLPGMKARFGGKPAA